MIPQAQILSSIIPVSTPSTYTLSVYARKAGGNNLDSYYRVNGGSWNSLPTVSSTTCGFLDGISSLSNGDTVEFAFEDVSTFTARLYALSDNTSSCPADFGVYGGDTIGSCSIYGSIVMGTANKNCAITLSVLDCE